MRLRHFTRDVPSAKQESVKILDCSEDGGSWRLKNAGAYVTGHPTSFARNRKVVIDTYLFITFANTSDDSYLCVKSCAF